MIMWLRPLKGRAWQASALLPRSAMLSTAANPTDGRFDGEAKCFAAEAVHPEVISRLRGPLNGVGDGDGAGTSGNTRSLFVRRRAAKARPVGYPALGGRYPHPHHPRDPAQYSNYRVRHG